MLDVTNRLVVIIGGGGVAWRKARGVLEAGAKRVRMVAPTMLGSEVPAAVERILANYEPSHLDGAGLVFAATDSPYVNDAVVRDARARGALACRADADEGEPGDFVSPAKLARGAVTVTVAAGSAALSAAIRDGLAQRFDPRWEAMADAMETVRPWVKEACGMDQSRRAEVFRLLATDEAFDELARVGVGGLFLWIAARFPELADG
jgi:siroheme synthase-like protein